LAAGQQRRSGGSMAGEGGTEVSRELKIRRSVLYRWRDGGSGASGSTEFRGGSPNSICPTKAQGCEGAVWSHDGHLRIAILGRKAGRSPSTRIPTNHRASRWAEALPA
jgi:hypothetical protein